jgi:hypothetical protein
MELSAQVLSALAEVAVMFVTNRQNKWWGSKQVNFYPYRHRRGDPGLSLFATRGNSHAQAADRYLVLSTHYAEKQKVRGRGRPRHAQQGRMLHSRSLQVLLYRFQQLVIPVFV